MLTLAFALMPLAEAVSPKTTDEIYKAVTDSQQNILNYMKSKPSVSTSGTDYYPDDDARIFLRMLDGNSKPINLGSCNATLYFPNNSKVFADSTMTLLERGFYYKDFTAPSTTGNYIVSFDCVTPSSPFFQNISYGSTLSIPANTPLVAYFGFDNTNNLTITNSPAIKVRGSGAKYNFWFNGNLVISNGGATNTTGITTAATLTAGQFANSETQQFTLECLTGCPYLLEWVSLNLTYSMNAPQDIIRGQNEVHIRHNPFNEADIIGNITALADGLIGNTTLLSNKLSGLDSGMAANSTNTNSLIISVNNTDSGYHPVTVCPSTSDIWAYPHRNLTYYEQNPFNENNIINNITYSHNSLANYITSVNETVRNINSTIIIPNFTVNETLIAKAVIDRLIAWRDLVFPKGLYL
jgi:hypothetical protein